MAQRQREGFIAQRALPLANGDVIEAGQVVPGMEDLDNDTWPNSRQLQRLGWVKKGPIPKGAKTGPRPETRDEMLEREGKKKSSEEPATTAKKTVAKSTTKTTAKKTTSKPTAKSTKKKTAKKKTAKKKTAKKKTAKKKTAKKKTAKKKTVPRKSSVGRKKSTAKKTSPPPEIATDDEIKAVLGGNAKEVVAAVKETTNLQELDRVEALESEDQERSTVLRAIKARRSKLKAG